jgi:hypothetical protein
VGFVRPQSHPNNTTMFGFVHLQSGLMPPGTVQSRAAIHRFLRPGSENFPGPEGCGSPAQTGAGSVKYLRLFLAIYGAGIAGTFA